MKSIMKLAERDAGHAALTAPRHQQHHNQFQSSLPNGKIELMWFVAADGALKWNESMKLIVFLFLIFCGLGAAGCRTAPQKRENKKKDN